MADKVDLVLDARAELGEGPIWDPDAGQLVWVDIQAGRLHRTDPSTGADSTLEVGRPVGSVALRRRGGLVLATDDGFRLLDPGSTTTRLLTPVEADRPLTRMNDGKVDPAGRFWAGTMARDEALSSAAYSGGKASGIVASNWAAFMMGPLRPPSAVANSSAFLPRSSARPRKRAPA